MKGYFSKLLTEQERSNSGAKSAKWGQRLKYDPDSEYEDQPRRASSSRHQQERWTGEDKNLTDVLGPLRGYLRKNLGRPWDDVYSELCTGLDRRSVSGLHVFSHLWQYVDKNCWIGAKTGKVYTDSNRGPQTVDEFYVHPWTGLLCEVPRRRRRWWMADTKPEPVTEIKLDEGKSYKQIEGIWYYTEWTRIKLWRRRDNCPEHWKESWKWEQVEDQVFQKKRQLGKKELKKLKLRNTVVIN